MMFSVMLCQVVLFVVSVVSQFYAPARNTYLLLIAVSAVLAAMPHLLGDRAMRIFPYVLHILFVLYCIYSSTVVWYEDICVMILAELFIFSTLILDNSVRVLCTVVISGIVYLVAVIGVKLPELWVDEVVNVVCFGALGSIVGVFVRKTQLQNFDTLQQLRLGQEHYQLALKHSANVICEYNVAERCIVLPEELAAQYGSPRRLYDLPYKPVQDGMISAETSAAYIQFYEDMMRGSENGTVEFERKMADGWRWQQARYSTMFADDGTPVSALVSCLDITEQRNQELLQREKAEKDGLTGAYNRQTVEERIVQYLKEHSGTSVAMILVDMDHLKTINDTFGHPQGDKAIKLLADSLRQNLREGDLLGRIGGDEFLVFVVGVESKQQVETRVLAWLQQLKALFVGDRNDHPVRASAGIVLGTAGAVTFDRLYAMADKALYSAKRGGRSQYEFYRGTID